VARRRPSAVRLDQRVSSRDRESSTRIVGIFDHGMRVVARLEHDRRRPGATADALRLYQRMLCDSARRLWDDRYGCGHEECCPQPAELRWWLEVVLRHLSPRDRRVLGARVGAVDDSW
jgi:hypothetical protein